MEHGADMKRVTNEGDTCLHLAVAKLNTDMIKKIIETCHQLINTPNNQGVSPLHLAVSFVRWTKILLIFTASETISTFEITLSHILFR